MNEVFFVKHQNWKEEMLYPKTFNSLEEKTIKTINRLIWDKEMKEIDSMNIHQVKNLIHDILNDKPMNLNIS